MFEECHTPLKCIPAFPAYVIPYYRLDFKMHMCQTELENDKQFMWFLSSLSYYHKMIVLRRKEFRSILTELKGSRALTALRWLAKLRMTCNQKTSGVFGNRSSKYWLHEENSVLLSTRELLILILVNHLIHGNIILEKEKCLITEIRIYHITTSK